MVYTKERNINYGCICGYGIPDLIYDTDGAAISENTVVNSSTNTGTSTEESKLSKLTSYIGSFISEFGSRVLTGDFSNTDYSSILNSINTSNTPSPLFNQISSNRYSSTSVSGNSDKEKVWNYLKAKGIPDIGIAGLMGNLQAESGIRFNNLEDTENTRLGITDAQYTSGVDNLSISKESFLYPFGTNNKDEIRGYGLAQWTSPDRKEKLYDLVKSRNVSISDPQAQLDHLWSELNNNYYKDVLSTMKNGSNIRAVSDKVLHKFENPRDASSFVETTRANYGQTIYNELSGGSGDGPTLSKRDKYRLNKANKMAKKYGGHGNSINYKNTELKRQSYSTSQYTNAGNAENYIRVSKDSSINSLLVNAIEILAAIAGNTSVTSSKLDALAYLKNIPSDVGNVTNIITPGNTNANVKTTQGSYNKKNENRSEFVARQIALGGY